MSEPLLKINHLTHRFGGLQALTDINVELTKGEIAGLIGPNGAGSSHVIHLHGDLRKVCSSRNPNDTRYIQTLPSDRPNVEPGTLAGDGSLLRPWIVWFGEAVPNLEPAAEEVMRADVFVIIGTSLNVYPAASLVRYVRRDAKIYLIDPNPVRVPSTREIHVIKNVASKGMEELKKEIG